MSSGTVTPDDWSPFSHMIPGVMWAQGRSMSNAALNVKGCRGHSASGIPAFLGYGDIPLRAIRMSNTTRG